MMEKNKTIKNAINDELNNEDLSVYEDNDCDDSEGMSSNGELEATGQLVGG
jgi:hypothetical protein